MCWGVEVARGTIMMAIIDCQLSGPRITQGWTSRHACEGLHDKVNSNVKPHPKGGWHHSPDFSSGLHKKEKANWTHGIYLSDSWPWMQFDWPPHVSTAMTSPVSGSKEIQDKHMANWGAY